jgi:peroxiredoxin
LADFENHRPELEELNTRIVAIASGSREDAEWMVTELRLGYPMGYDLDPEAAALTIGCYTGVHEGCPHVQPAGFILDPDSTVIHAVYSSGKVGRLTASDVLTVLRERLQVPVSGHR